MPDASDPRARGPIDWADAFAALPPEAPPADGWARLSARLDARDPTPAIHATPMAPAPVAEIRGARRFGRRRVARAAGWFGAATAAVLALVVAWPRYGARPVFPKPHDTASASATSTATPGIAPPTRAIAVDAALAAGRNAANGGATAIALPKAVEAARKPQLAARASPVAGNDAATKAKAGRATPTAADLDALYAESARLEALLALARDDRVASAGAALLASELEAQVAGIDASLAQGGLDDAQRRALWQARVDALRQAAGFESTQRVLASQGDVGALLVSVD